MRGGTFPTDLLSTLGELQVYRELQRKFNDQTVNFKRKARADISIESLLSETGYYNIEVKTSNLKKEDYGEGYGFALHVKKCRKHPEAFFDHARRGKIPGDFCYLDFLICLAMNGNDFLKSDYYIFSREELNAIAPQIVNKSPRFWFAPYRILIPTKPDIRQRGKIYGDFDLSLRYNKDFKNNWGKIKV